MFESYESLMERYKDSLDTVYEVFDLYDDCEEESFSYEATEAELIEEYVNNEGWWGHPVSYEEFRIEYCKDCNPIFW